MNLPLDTATLGLALPPASPRFIDLNGAAAQKAPASAADELTAGLTMPVAVIAPKFFYDELGSRLFDAITRLDEYYPTRTEAAIFEADRHAIAEAVATAGVHNACLIDLGAGNCAKAMALIPYLQPAQYVPVDISSAFLRESAEQVQGSFPGLDILGLGMDFSAHLHLPSEVQAHDRVFFYPGSSLGNFHPGEALDFLRRIADPAQGAARGLLIGIDLVKDTRVLEAAYDDALGVTAAFNKNTLRNVNNILGADFDTRQWRHVALFNRGASRIEMHLEAQEDLTVSWGSHRRRFSAGERIHTECSYKYTVESMAHLLRNAGFAQMRHWTDPQGWFAVFWAAV